MFVEFPFNLRFQTSGFHVVGASSTPVQSIGGAYSVQPRLGAHWVGAVTFLTTNEETRLALQAFVAGMEGMLGTTSVPVFQRQRPRDGQGRLAAQCAVAPLGDTSMVAGGGSQSAEFWGFANEPAVYGTLASAAAVRDTEIAVLPTNYTGFRPGHDLTIAGRLHRAVQVRRDGDYDLVRITPPLRAAAQAGDIVVLDAPTCLMRFASETEGQQFYSPSPVSAITMNFVEAI